MNVNLKNKYGFICTNIKLHRKYSMFYIKYDLLEEEDYLKLVHLCGCRGKIKAMIDLKKELCYTFVNQCRNI